MTWAARILLIALAVVVLIVILRMVGARQLRSKYALLWIVVGALLVPIAAFPVITDTVADWLGIAYPPALALVGAVVVLLLVVMHYSWELSRLEGRTRDLAQEVAILRRALETRDGVESDDVDDGTPDDAEERS